MSAIVASVGPVTSSARGAAAPNEPAAAGAGPFGPFAGPSVLQSTPAIMPIAVTMISIVRSRSITFEHDEHHCEAEPRE